ncbi:MAG: hypothetical protein M0Z46_06485 [Actinomycetota bacterium]|jgi:hypothetical protein|nr:hypothetical protein [Actinomycetota bacterium]
MMIDGCSLCGAIGPVARHHLTRRPGRGVRYFDEHLTVLLCASCHSRVHQVLRVADLDWLPSGVDPLAYRLRTVAVHCEVFGTAGRDLVLAPSSAQALAALLRGAVPAHVDAADLREGAA